MSGLKQSSTLMKKMMSEDIFYNDFTGDANIPKSGRIFCKSCERWIPEDGTGGIHTCHCAKQARGEDVSECQCAIHRETSASLWDIFKSRIAGKKQE